MRLTPELNDQIPTARTDGTVIQFNPKAVREWTASELLFVYAHEVAHCAYCHPWRFEGRDPETANIAADIVVNQMLIDDKLMPPKGCVMPDPKYRGMSFEQVYAALRNKPKPQAPPQPGSGAPAPGQGSRPGQQGPPTGDVVKAGSLSGTKEDGTPDKPQLSEHDWRLAAEAATMACKAAGQLGGGAERVAQVNRTPVPDWRAILREFVEHSIPSDYSWQQPNRRFIGGGIYLPGVYRENAAAMVMAVDTSGSVTQEILDLFAAQATEIVQEVRPETLHVVYCDAEVNGSQEFSPDDVVTLKMCGGGGTRFQPALDWVEQQGIEPRCLIYLTDLENGRETITQPDGYPVLWVTPEWTTKTAPWGETIRITEGM
jgi:predicted metal-dependent peptidase